MLHAALTVSRQSGQLPPVTPPDNGSSAITGPVGPRTRQRPRCVPQADSTSSSSTALASQPSDICPLQFPCLQIRGQRNKCSWGKKINTPECGWHRFLKLFFSHDLNLKTAQQLSLEMTVIFFSLFRIPGIPQLTANLLLKMERRFQRTFRLAKNFY